MKRVFDIVISFLGLILLLPLFVVVTLWIVVDSKGPVFYCQRRVGRNGRDFVLYKFRSMRAKADQQGLLTVGGRDLRITPLGYHLRRYKIDELPQLINVFVGDMSFVGPRPELRKYVELYNSRQRQVLLARPGITDPASIKYRNENQLLAQQSNPEEYYISCILPDKLKLSLDYLHHRSFWSDLKVIFQTIF